MGSCCSSTEEQDQNIIGNTEMLVSENKIKSSYSKMGQNLSILKTLNEDTYQYYEELTKTYRYRDKFQIQDQASDYFKTLFISNNQTNLETAQPAGHTRKGSSNFQALVNQFQEFENYKLSVEDLKKQCELQQKFTEKDMKIYQVPIGNGGQAQVELNFLYLQQNRQEQNQNKDKERNDLIPIATKTFEDRDQFIRESSVLFKLDSNLRPIVAFLINKKQQINMELCMCTLAQFKKFANENNLFSDNLFLQMSLNLFTKVQSLLEKQIFHGDIKPDNIAIALRNGKPDLIFIDYGAASWNNQDYMNLLTRAYSSKEIFLQIESGVILNEDQIRYAEFYSVSRSIQNLMLNMDKTEDQLLFLRERQQEFISQFEKKYPKTIKLLKPILLNQYDCQISQNLYEEFLKSNEDIMSRPFQFDPQNIFDSTSILSQLSFSS